MKTTASPTTLFYILRLRFEPYNGFRVASFWAFCVLSLCVAMRKIRRSWLRWLGATSLLLDRGLRKESEPIQTGGALIEWISHIVLPINISQKLVSCQASSYDHHISSHEQA